MLQRSGFDFERFKNDPCVIPFANGYGVNLYGQKIQGDGLIDRNAKPTGRYTTVDGIAMPGRLIWKEFGFLREVVF